MNIIELLKRCEVFVGLTDSDLQRIAALPSWQRQTFDAGEYIFQSGTAASDFYILEDGQVNLFVLRMQWLKKPVQVPVDTITKGDVFGWSALIRPHSRAGTAICVKPSSVVAVRGAELIELMDRDHSLGYEVMNGLARVIGGRFRQLTDKVANIT